MEWIIMRTKSEDNCDERWWGRDEENKDVHIYREK